MVSVLPHLHPVYTESYSLIWLWCSSLVSILSSLIARASANAVWGVSLPRKRHNDGLQQHAEAWSQTGVRDEILPATSELNCRAWTWSLIYVRFGRRYLVRLFVPIFTTGTTVKVVMVQEVKQHWRHADSSFMLQSATKCIWATYWTSNPSWWLFHLCEWVCIYVLLMSRLPPCVKAPYRQCVWMDGCVLKLLRD